MEKNELSPEAKKAKSDYMRDYMREYMKKWRKENPNKAKQIRDRYWEKKAGVDGRFRTFESAEKLAKWFGVPFERDVETGAPIINGKKIPFYVTGKDDVLINTRNVASGLGYQVYWDAESEIVTLKRTQQGGISS